MTAVRYTSGLLAGGHVTGPYVDTPGTRMTDGPRLACHCRDNTHVTPHVTTETAAAGSALRIEDALCPPLAKADARVPGARRESLAQVETVEYRAGLLLREVQAGFSRQPVPPREACDKPRRQHHQQ